MRCLRFSRKKMYSIAERKTKSTENIRNNNVYKYFPEKPFDVIIVKKEIPNITSKKKCFLFKYWSINFSFFSMFNFFLNVKSTIPTTIKLLIIINASTTNFLPIIQSVNIVDENYAEPYFPLLTKQDDVHYLNTEQDGVH